jgi:hypothetical protein
MALFVMLARAGHRIAALAVFASLLAWLRIRTRLQ